MKIFEDLCYKDPRNPLQAIVCEGEGPPRTDCYCENCFYGCDRLALTVIDLLEACKILQYECALICRDCRADVSYCDSCPTLEKITKAGEAIAKAEGVRKV